MSAVAPRKVGFSLSRFPEIGLLLAIVVLGLLLSAFGGSVERPKFRPGPDGTPERVFTTGADGEQTPAFETVNKFFNPRTLTQIAKDASFVAIMAVGATVVLISGNVDLSVGAIYALSSVLGAIVFSRFGADGNFGTVIVGVLTTLLVGLLAGLFNGTMVVAFKVHPFIITLGTMSIYRGIAFVLTNGQSISNFPEAFRQLVRFEILPELTLVPILVMLLVAAAGAVFLSRMAVGRKIYAIGGNELASRFSGIRVGRVKLLVFILSGVTAGLAAVMAQGYYGGSSSGDGQGYELNVIAAAVVGGASLSGGKGTALGALLGAFLLQMISTGLVILNIPQNYSQIVTGAVLILAVLFDQFNAWLTHRRLLARAGRVRPADGAAAPPASGANGAGGTTAAGRPAAPVAGLPADAEPSAPAAASPEISSHPHHNSK